MKSKNIIFVIFTILVSASFAYTQDDRPDYEIYAEGYGKNPVQMRIAEMFQNGTGCKLIDWDERGGIIEKGLPDSEDQQALLRDLASDITDYTYSAYKWSNRVDWWVPLNDLPKAFVSGVTIAALEQQGVVLPLPNKLPKRFCGSGSCSVPSARKVRILATDCGSILFTEYVPQCANEDLRWPPEDPGARKVYKIEKDLKIRTALDDYVKEIFYPNIDTVDNHAWYISRVYPKTISKYILAAQVRDLEYSDFYYRTANLIEGSKYIVDLYPFGSVARTGFEYLYCSTGWIENCSSVKKLEEAGGGWELTKDLTFDALVDGLPLLAQVQKLKKTSKYLWTAGMVGAVSASIYNSTQQNGVTYNDIGRLLVLALVAPDVFKTLSPSLDNLAKDIQEWKEVAEQNPILMKEAMKQAEEQILKNPELTAIFSESEKVTRPFTVNSQVELAERQMLHKLDPNGANNAVEFFENGVEIIDDTVSSVIATIQTGEEVANVSMHTKLDKMLQESTKNPITVNSNVSIRDNEMLLEEMRQSGNNDLIELAGKFEATVENGLSSAKDGILGLFEKHGADISDDILYAFAEKQHMLVMEAVQQVVNVAPSNFRLAVYASNSNNKIGIVGKTKFPWYRIKESLTDLTDKEVQIVDNLVSRLEGYDALESWEVGLHRFQDAAKSGVGVKSVSEGGNIIENINYSEDSINFRSWAEKQPPQKIFKLVQQRVEKFLENPITENLGRDFVQKRFEKEIGLRSGDLRKLKNTLLYDRQTIQEADVFFLVSANANNPRIVDQNLLHSPRERILPSVWTELGKPGICKFLPIPRGETLKLYTHIKGDIQNFELKPNKIEKAPVIRGGTHLLRNVFTDVDKSMPRDLSEVFERVLDPNYAKFYIIGGKTGSETMQAVLFKHFEIDNFKSLDELIELMPPQVVTHSNGVTCIELPEGIFSDKAYKATKNFSDLIRSDPAKYATHFAGYPDGGKTFFPKDWDQCKINDAIIDVLKQNGLDIKNMPATGRGNIWAKHDGVWVVVNYWDGKIISSFPTWLQP